MDAFLKMQKKFDTLMDQVATEEEKFREIESRYVYDARSATAFL